MSTLSLSGCDTAEECRQSPARRLYRGFPCLSTPLCCSPLAEDAALLRVLLDEALLYAIGHGLAMVDAHGSASPVPFTLLPSPFPRAAFERLHELAVPFNVLYERVSRDLPFLKSVLSEVVAVDPFIARLLRVAEEADSAGERQPLRLCINRSDYLLHSHEDGSFTPQQVEFNTIAAGMACLSTAVSDMHAYLLARHAPHYSPDAQLPGNAAMQGVVKAMAITLREYERSTGDSGAAVLMVVQAVEWNRLDQQLLAWALWREHSIPTLRRTLAEVHAEAVMDAHGRLRIDGRVIGLAYFRAGYSPTHFISEHEWAALLTLERSMAVKCPSAAYHLAGCKRVQQALCSRATLQHFVSPEQADALLSSFTSLHALQAGQPDTQLSIAAALADPTSFVLKPQREGGGHTLWGDELVHLLSSASPAQLAAHVLMRRIHAPASSAAGVRHGQVVQFRGTSELGVFGVHLSDGHTTLINAAAGYLLRTKFATSHEGGIAAGHGFLDSAVLV